MNTSTDIAIGSVIRLPFWIDQPCDEFYDYEVEKTWVGKNEYLGTTTTFAKVIKLENGKREKDRQGHFRRRTVTIEEIRQFNG
jgi:hypothetical protein